MPKETISVFVDVRISSHKTDSKKLHIKALTEEAKMTFLQARSIFPSEFDIDAGCLRNFTKWVASKGLTIELQLDGVSLVSHKL